MKTKLLLLNYHLNLILICLLLIFTFSDFSICFCESDPTTLPSNTNVKESLWDSETRENTAILIVFLIIVSLLSGYTL